MIRLGLVELGVEGPALFLRINLNLVFMYLSISKKRDEQSLADRRIEFLLISIESYSYLGLN